MPTKLNEIKTLKDKYLEIVKSEIDKLKSGYGLTAAELAAKCGISLSQFRNYGFHKIFKIEKHNKVNYYVK